MRPLDVMKAAALALLASLFAFATAATFGGCAQAQPGEALVEALARVAQAQEGAASRVLDDCQEKLAAKRQEPLDGVRRMWKVSYVRPGHAREWVFVVADGRPDALGQVEGLLLAAGATTWNVEAAEPEVAHADAP